MGYKSIIEETTAGDRRQQREARRRSRELERQAKEQAKLSEQEKARFAVATFENQLEILLSLQKEQGEPWDWIGVAASLPPAAPAKNLTEELKLRQRAAALRPFNIALSDEELRAACNADSQIFQAAREEHSVQLSEWEKLKELAKRILMGDSKAYTEALVELNPFAELSQLGSTIHFTFHTPQLVECLLTVSGEQAIPAEIKSLTASGKLSVRAMPKTRFHEIYQDYVCGCILRVARELFALLPVNTVLVTAAVNQSTKHPVETASIPVLSVAIHRQELANFDFSSVDPSDAIEGLHHQGDFKASRKGDAFSQIAPLTVEELSVPRNISSDIQDLIGTVRGLRTQVDDAMGLLKRRATVTTSNPVTA